MERKLTDQELARREKMNRIKDMNLDPFGHRFDRTNNSAEIKEKYGSIEHDELENMDIHVSDMDNYIALKKQLEKNNENLEKANKKSLELKQNSKDIKDKIDKLKTSKLNKENYILTKADKDLFIDFINEVDNTNKEYDKIRNLSNTLTNVDEQFKEKVKAIKTLTETMNWSVDQAMDALKISEEDKEEIRKKYNIG